MILEVLHPRTGEVRARVRFLELGLSLENVLGTANRAFQAHYASDFSDPGDGVAASMRATAHFAAAAPRLWMLTLTAYFDDAAFVTEGGVS